MRGFRICCFSSLLAGDRAGRGWVEVFIIAHGPGLSLLGRRSNHDPSQGIFIFSYFLLLVAYT